MRIAKSSKEQDGYEAPDTTGARLSPEAPEGTAGATSKVTPKKLAKPILVSRGAQKNFKRATSGNSGDQEALVSSRSVATTWVPRYGFGRKTLPSGKSSSSTVT